MDIKPEARAQCIGLKKIAVAFIKVALAHLGNPVHNGNAEEEFDKVVLGVAISLEQGEVKADLSNVMASEGVTSQKAKKGCLRGLGIGPKCTACADQVEGHSGHGIGSLTHEAFPGFAFGDGSAIGMNGDLGLEDCGVQGAHFVSNRIIKPVLNFAINEIVDAFTGQGGVEESLQGLVHATRDDHLGGSYKP